MRRSEAHDHGQGGTHSQEGDIAPLRPFQGSGYRLRILPPAGTTANAQAQTPASADLSGRAKGG